MQIPMDATRLYNLMRSVSRVYYGHGDHWEALRRIAQDLCDTTITEEAGTILLGSWHLSEVPVGGYDTDSEFRESLGAGTFLGRWLVSEESTQQGATTRTKSITVQAWKQEKRVVFLAFREEIVDGYVGIDNHPGTDTTWEVTGLRVIDVD
jgi:hypothetical protein